MPSYKLKSAVTVTVSACLIHMSGCRMRSQPWGFHPLFTTTGAAVPKADKFLHWNRDTACALAGKLNRQERRWMQVLSHHRQIVYHVLSERFSSPVAKSWIEGRLSSTSLLSNAIAIGLPIASSCVKSDGRCRSICSGSFCMWLWSGTIEHEVCSEPVASTCYMCTAHSFLFLRISLPYGTRHTCSVCTEPLSLFIGASLKRAPQLTCWLGFLSRYIYRPADLCLWSGARRQGRMLRAKSSRRNFVWERSSVLVHVPSHSSSNGPYSPKGKKWRRRAPGGIMPR